METYALGLKKVAHCVRISVNCNIFALYACNPRKTLHGKLQNFNEISLKSELKSSREFASLIRSLVALQRIEFLTPVCCDFPELNLIRFNYLARVWPQVCLCYVVEIVGAYFFVS